MRLWLLALLTIVVQAQNSFNITNEEEFSQQKVYDVVIVGGGLTGLTAARKILEEKPSASVLILEARGQVGGRIRARTVTTNVGDEWLDLGSQFISPKHEELISLTKKYNIQLCKQAMCGQNTVLVEGIRRRKRQTWTSSIPSGASFSQVLQSPDAERLGNMTVGDFTVTSGMSHREAASMNRLLQTLYDAPENLISPLTISLTAGSDQSSVSDLLMDFGHGSSYLAVGSMYNVVRSMADGIHIEYNQQVTTINHAASPAVLTTTSGSFRAQQVLVTVPPTVAGHITVVPTLSSSFSSFLEKYSPKGDAFYFTMTFPTPFWRAQNRNGQVIYTSSKEKIAWLTTFDVTPDSECVSTREKTGILWGIAHIIDAPQDERQRYQLYIDVIAKAMGGGSSPLDVKDVRFSSDPTALGSIGAFGPMRDLSILQFLNGVHSESKAVHFASAEYSNKSMGLMNGAVISGNLAADLLLSQFNRPVTASFQYDQPSTQQQPNVGAYMYSTSTHYPPTTPPLAIKIIFAPPTSNNNGTMYPYSTSTHYPMTQTETPARQTNISSVQRDPAGFKYETSSHYPPTPAMETTTMVHFSMGNQETKDKTVNQKPNAGFTYMTSTHYPPISQTTMAPGSFQHFSLGNVNNETKQPVTNLILGPAQSVATRSTYAPTNPPTPPTTRLQTGSTTPFIYRTTTPYPANNKLETDKNFQHFSLGNVGNANSASNDLTQLHIAKDQMSAVPSTVLNGNVAVGPVPANILTELQAAVQDAPQTNQLSLATRLSGIVKNLLESLRALSR